MAAQNLAGLTELLLRHTKKPNTPIAVIEQATTQHQRVHISTLATTNRDFAGMKFSSPSLVIIGDVVKLHEQFNWYNANKAGSVFHELVTVK
jgi:siroheme synthase